MLHRFRSAAWLLMAAAALACAPADETPRSPADSLGAQASAPATGAPGGAALASDTTSPDTLIGRVPDTTALHVVIYPESGAVRPPAELYVTDPRGRASGFFPETRRVYHGIPGSVYEGAGPGADTLSQLALDILEPAEGDYLVEVNGAAAGTYTLEIRTVHDRGRAARVIAPLVQIAPGATHRYRFAYERDTSATLVLTRDP